VEQVPAEAPVLLEVPVQERATAQLKCVFDGVNANGVGQANKAELLSALEQEQGLDALLKDAGMSDRGFVRRLGSHDGEFVSWDEFLQFAAKTVVQGVVHEVEVAVEQVASHVMAGEKALVWLLTRFEGLVAEERAFVSKEELAAKLKETDDVDGESMTDLIAQAGFNPSWNSIDQVDTKEDGHISWEEFKAHVCHSADEEAVMVEEIIVKQRCLGCC